MIARGCSGKGTGLDVSGGVDCARRVHWLSGHAQIYQGTHLPSDRLESLLDYFGYNLEGSRHWPPTPVLQPLLARLSSGGSRVEA